ncbi:MAG: asparaginase domain-containing protein [Pyramidobacter sp.]|jgi:L-asparaginase
MPNQTISLVIAGGEIVQGLENGPGAAQQNENAETIRSWIPAEMADSVKLVDWSHQPGSHYSLHMTGDLVELLNQQVTGGAHAVVVFCGSDAAEEMAYLADLMWIYPQPLIFAVTRSTPGEPGSDALKVMSEALTAANARESWGQGVLLCANGRLYAASDVTEASNYGRGVYMGNFRESAGCVCGGAVHFWQLPRRSKVFDRTFTPARNVELLEASLGSGERFLQALTEEEHPSLDGLVIAGFGGGNVYPAWVSYLKTLVRSGVPVVMTSRCRQGCVLDSEDFEGAFAKLSEFGVMSGGFLTPLQARIKLAVGLGAGLKDDELQKYLLDQ